MKTTARLYLTLLAAASILFLSATTARAQYMFLDSNGDGRNDPRDRLPSEGWSYVDVWLDLAAHGGPAEAAKQTLAAYEFVIQGDADVEWGAFTPADSKMKIVRGPLVGPGAFYVGVACPQVRTGPKHRLGRVRVRPMAGLGDVSIVPCAAMQDTAYTSFQRQPGGPKFRLGPTLLLTSPASVVEGEWHDADGVSFESEPLPSLSRRVDRGFLYLNWNRMTPPYDFNVVEGNVTVNGYVIPGPSKPSVPEPTLADRARHRAGLFAAAVGGMAQRWGSEATSAWIGAYQLSPAVDAIVVHPGGVRVRYRGSSQGEVVSCPDWSLPSGTGRGAAEPFQDLLEAWARALESRSLLSVVSVGQFRKIPSGERIDEAIRKLQGKELLSGNDSLALERTGRRWSEIADPPPLVKAPR